MIIALGLFIGVISGTVQFFLLSKFTGALTTGKMNNKTILFAITQFLFPFAVLVVTAFLLQDSLMWTGIGMGVALLICAAIKFILTSRTNKTEIRAEKK